MLKDWAEMKDWAEHAPVLVLHGTSFEPSGAEEALASVLERDDTLAVKVPSAPVVTLKSIEEHRDLMSSVKTIVLVGGGRIMDLGKCIALELSGTTLREFLNTRETKGEVPTIFAVPTTAGSGSESTRYAVIYKGHIKQSITHPSIQPREAVIDWTLLRSCPPYVLATSGLDALCQTIESYWSTKGTEASRNKALQGMQLLWPTLWELSNGPSDDSLKTLAEGSHLSGQALNVSSTTAAHACSYVLTAHFGITHGHAVTLMLAQLCPFVESKGHDISTILETIGARDGEHFRSLLMELMERLELPSNLKALDVDLDVVLKEAEVNINIARLANLPVPLSMDEIHGLYQRAFEG